MIFHGQSGGMIALDDVARGMSFAADVAIFVDFIATGSDDFRVERHIALRQADAVELELHVTLAPKMAGIFGGFEVADEIGTAGESLLAEFGDCVQTAEHGVSDSDSGRGEVWVHPWCISEGYRRAGPFPARWHSGIKQGGMLQGLRNSWTS